MSKKSAVFVLATSMSASVQLAEAQAPAKVPRIGYLAPRSAVPKEFKQGLRELGYVEGQNIVIEGRFAEGKFDRFPRFAAELVRLKVDVIVTLSSPAARTANSVGTDGSKCRAAGQLLTLDRPRKVPQ